MPQRAPAPPIWFISLTIASGVAGMTLVSPALPLVMADLGASSAAVQMLLTAYLIALAAGQLVYGTVSDCLGRRPVLLFGATIYSLGGFIAIFAESIEALTLYRILQGLGAAACLSMGRAIINDCFERQDAARSMATAQTIMAIVPVLALTLGGLLTEWGGWQSTMAIIGIAGVVVLLVALLTLKETNLWRVKSINLDSLASAYGSVLKSPVYLAYALTNGMQIGMFFSMLGFLPYQYVRLGVSPAEFGLWFALTPVSFIIGNIVNRYYFIDRGIERAAMLGCLLTMVSVVAMYATQFAGMAYPLAIALPCCLFGFSNGIVISNTVVGAIHASGDHAGTGTGLLGAWQMAFGGFAGVVIIGLGGAEDFLLAVTSLIFMSIVSVSSIFYIYRHHNVC